MSTHPPTHLQLPIEKLFVDILKLDAIWYFGGTYGDNGSQPILSNSLSALVPCFHLRE